MHLVYMYYINSEVLWFHEVSIRVPHVQFGQLCMARKVYTPCWEQTMLWWQRTQTGWLHMA